MIRGVGLGVHLLASLAHVYNHALPSSTRLQPYGNINIPTSLSYTCDQALPRSPVVVCTTPPPHRTPEQPLRPAHESPGRQDRVDDHRTVRRGAYDRLERRRSPRELYFLGRPAVVGGGHALVSENGWAMVIGTCLFFRGIKKVFTYHTWYTQHYYCLVLSTSLGAGG